jgi:hypothetical protein
MTGYENDNQHRLLSGKLNASKDAAPTVRRIDPHDDAAARWEAQTQRRELEKLIASLKAHPDLADKLYAIIKVRP